MESIRAPSTRQADATCKMLHGQRARRADANWRPIRTRRTAPCANTRTLCACRWPALVGFSTTETELTAKHCHHQQHDSIMLIPHQVLSSSMLLPTHIPSSYARASPLIDTTRVPQEAHSRQIHIHTIRGCDRHT